MSQRCLILWVFISKDIELESNLKIHRSILSTSKEAEKVHLEEKDLNRKKSELSFGCCLIVDYC